jgi:TolB protein
MQRAHGTLSALSIATVAAILLATAQPAAATYPGANGKLAFVSTEASTPEIPTTHIVTSNQDGTGTTDLTPNSTAFELQPDWSPNGRKILFASTRNEAREIYVMNADGSEQTRLTDNPARDDDASWSPNGKQIVFASDRDGTAQIYQMNADGSRVRRLTHDTAFDFQPAFSPGGDKIVFVSTRGGAPALWVMSVDGGDARQVTVDELGAFAPDWSPDGKRIAFFDHCCVPENSDILVINANGKHAMPLTQSFGNNLDPNWSPDGQKIAFDHASGPFTDIYVANADGSGAPTAITSTPGVSEFDPDWSSQ